MVAFNAIANERPRSILDLWFLRMETLFAYQLSRRGIDHMNAAARHASLRDVAVSGNRLIAEALYVKAGGRAAVNKIHHLTCLDARWFAAND